jgi:pimeloyl-ACP methyl ester carboxylesterase
MKSLFLLTLFLFTTSFAQAGDIKNCEEMITPIPEMKGGLCIYPGKQNADVVYYLHGKDGDAKIWESEGFWSQQIRDYWKDKGLAQPTIVSVSLGAVWLLAPKTTAPAGFGMLDYFVGKVMPEIEGRRILLGDSMGGFNALQLGLKTDLFAKVAALCAPIADGITPFSTDEAIESYIRKSSAMRSGKQEYDTMFSNLKTVQMVVGFFWANDEEFKGSDPVVLARALRSPRASKFYLAAGFFDHYVTYEGNAALATALQASGTSVDWRPQWGDHCAVDVPSLAEFLVK